MPLPEMNDVRLHIIDAGKFKLDGGAMFGVVPKSMWQKLNPADEHNMCTWSLRCLLVVDGDRKILIDTGMGEKQDEKFRSHFYPHGDSNLLQSVHEAGYSPEEITDVFLTHLHFDHVGGALFRQGDEILPTFSNAKYWSNEYHYNWALNPNEKEKASFLKENIVPMMDHKILHFIDVRQGIQFSDHISLNFVYGHTGAMMIPTITLANGKKIIYCADLLPSSGHIGLPYVMAYDVFPLTTMEEKNELFERAVASDTYLFLEHDKDHALISVEKNEKGRVMLKEACDIELVCNS